MKAMFGIALAVAMIGGVHAQEAAAPAAPPAPAVATPAASDAAPAADAPAVATAETPKRKQICTRERSMGSNMTKRVCRDADAVEDIGNLTRDTMQRTQQIGINAPAQTQGQGL